MSRKMSERQKFEQAAKRKVDNFTAFHPVLSEFHHNRRGQRQGVVVSFVSDGKIYVGCSLCNLKRDRWNNYVGLNYAIERASNNRDDFVKVPHTLRGGVTKMIDRAVRYFKNAA